MSEIPTGTNELLRFIAAVAEKGGTLSSIEHWVAKGRDLDHLLATPPEILGEKGSIRGDIQRVHQRLDRIEEILWGE